MLVKRGRRTPRAWAGESVGALIVLAMSALLAVLIGTVTLSPEPLPAHSVIVRATSVIFAGLLVVLMIGAGIWMFRGRASLSGLIDAYPASEADIKKGAQGRRCGWWTQPRMAAAMAKVE